MFGEKYLQITDKCSIFDDGMLIIQISYSKQLCLSRV